MSDKRDESQPAPKPGTVGVVDWIIKEWNLSGDKDGTPWARIRDLLRERRAFGVRKYGRILEAHNGRDPVKDAQDELIDGFVYIEQAVIESRKIPRLQALAMIELAEAIVADVKTMMED